MIASQVSLDGAEYTSTVETLKEIARLQKERETLLDFIVVLTRLRGDDPFQPQYKRVEANFQVLLKYYTEYNNTNEEDDDDQI